MSWCGTRRLPVLSWSTAFGRWPGPWTTPGGWATRSEAPGQPACRAPQGSVSRGPTQAATPHPRPPLWMLPGCPGFLQGPSSPYRAAGNNRDPLGPSPPCAGQHTTETGQRPPGPRWGHAWHSEPADPHRGCGLRAWGHVRAPSPRSDSGLLRPATHREPSLPGRVRVPAWRCVPRTFTGPRKSTSTGQCSWPSSCTTTAPR